MPIVIKGKKKKKGKTVDYSLPYEGAIGISDRSEWAKKSWERKASADELILGYKLTTDADGNYIARTKLSSKA
tara:strand:+ start:1072 stop:1290 length:219 start_codon:yes stop_codon:yes gene_type:complete